MSSSKTNARRRNRGFTLVELLVVIAIIGLLGAIAVPAVTKMVDSGRTASSMSNLRQVGLAGLAYANENKGYLTTNRAGTHEDGASYSKNEHPFKEWAWMGFLGDDLTLPDGARNNYNHKFQYFDIMRCDVMLGLRKKRKANLSRYEEEEQASFGFNAILIPYGKENPTPNIYMIEEPSKTFLGSNAALESDGSLSFVMRSGREPYPAYNGESMVLYLDGSVAMIDWNQVPDHSSAEGDLFWRGAQR